MHGFGNTMYRILSIIFGEEKAPTAFYILLISLGLVYIGLVVHEYAVYRSRFGDRASWKGFRRFQKEYPAEIRRKAEARRKEREARKEARLREKNEQKENKD